MDLEVLVNKAITLEQYDSLSKELIIRLEKIGAERDWLAKMIVAVHETGYCPPHRECPVGDYTLPSQEDCTNCWLRAAREAVREKQ